MEEENTDKPDSGGRSTAPIPKEKVDAPVDKDSELLGELVEVEGEHNAASKTVTQGYTELVEEQALSTTDSI